LGKRERKYIHRDQEDEKDSKGEDSFSLFKFLPLSPLITFIPVRFFFSLSQGVNLCPT
jgi:hypothetical protein